MTLAQVCWRSLMLYRSQTAANVLAGGSGKDLGPVFVGLTLKNQAFVSPRIKQPAALPMDFLAMRSED